MNQNRSNLRHWVKTHPVHVNVTLCSLIFLGFVSLPPLDPALEMRVNAFLNLNSSLPTTTFSA